MRLKLAALSIVALAAALPAAAQHGRDRHYDQGYGQDYRGQDYRYEECRNEAKKKQAVGAVIGGLIGGVAGNKIAARNAQDEGAVLGAVVGAIAGSQIAKSKADCDRREDRYGYVNDPEYDDRYYSNGFNTNEYYPDDQYRGEASGRGIWRNDELAGGRSVAYNNRYKHERDCTDVVQITRLPDGREVHRAVEVCRSGGDGDWDIRD